jgi:predicted GH43/DUF377 family glycosyl hydrolase
MKKVILILCIILPLFILSSCSKENLTQSSPETQAKVSDGKVLLKIDKSNVPSGVTFVYAYLSRNGHDSLSSSMNIKSDSTADITFSNLEIGSWHLRVDAKSSLGTVLYTGQSDITVTEGITTQVNLALTPTGLGVGSIQINVTWKLNSQWIDYALNPIFSASDSPTNPYGGVSTAKVVYDEGKYKMWYLNTYESGRGDVGYAESMDGIKWTSASSQAVLSAGSNGNWDDYTVAPGAIIKDNGIFKMYYSGFHNQLGEYNIGYATSQDGIHWQKSQNPVIYSTSLEYQLGVMDIIKCGTTYFLFYTSRSADLSNNRINLATSTDGVNWSRYSGNPILTATQSWEGTGVAFPTAIYENGLFKLLYMNFAGTGFGVATSTDGFHWTKDANNPVFKLSDVSNHWCTKIQYPYWKKFGTQYRLYYSGTVGAVNKIAVAIK